VQQPSQAPAPQQGSRFSQFFAQRQGEVEASRRGSLEEVAGSLGGEQAPSIRIPSPNQEERYFAPISPAAQTRTMTNSLLDMIGKGPVGPQGGRVQELEEGIRRQLGLGGHLPGMGGHHPAMGGQHPAMGGQHPSMHPNLPGQHPGMGGQHPSMGGQHPGMGGQHPNMGGQHPNMGGQHPVMGGQHPAMGGQHPTLPPHYRHHMAKEQEHEGMSAFKKLVSPWGSVCVGCLT